jgi:glycosyltransferase involved in cell wall biosynthesis
VYAMSEAGASAGAGTAKPLVSVLIDTYNYGCYIEEAIESVLSQDFPEERREVLVVDDGSEDDTEERVKKFGARVRYLRKANGGQASALNAGMAAARGEIVALLDGDDYWLPGKLRRVVEEFARWPEAGMVYHRVRELDTRTGEQKEGAFAAVSGDVPASRKALLRYILYPTSALAFRRRCVEALLPIPEGLRIQADAHLSGLVIFVAPVVAIEESLAMYRVHGRNLFHTAEGEAGATAAERARRRMATRKTLIEGMKSWLEEKGFDTKSGKIRSYLVQWSLAQETDAFTIAAPGRMQFVRHLWRCSYYFAPRVTWRHWVVNYVNTFGALIVGYERFGLLEEWRLKVTRPLRGALGTSAPGRTLIQTKK